MPYKFIQRRTDGPVTTITLNRPEVMNALHAPAQFELSEALDAFADDPDQWVAIITGAGDRAFCAGGDLKALAGDGGKGRPAKGFGGLTSRFDLDKPLIAAVNGAAYGGGFEAALACDVILASEAATFALPEPRRGLAALGGGIHRLARDIGPKRAMGMILTGDPVSAAEGLRLGFVTQVLPPAELLPTARRWAEQICSLSPMAIRASKEVVYRGLAEPGVEAAMRGQRKYPAVQALMASDDFHEGPRAFKEGRAPVWKGR